MQYNKRKPAGDRDVTHGNLLQRATEFTDVIFEDLTLTAAIPTIHILPAFHSTFR
jgi:hypothetical protein